MVQAAFDMLNPFLRLSIHSFNVECVFGFTLLPTSVAGKWVIGAFSTSLAGVQATMLAILVAI